MHQNRFRLGSAPQTPSWIKGGLLLREGEGIWERRGRGGKGGEDGGGEGKGRGGEGRATPIFYYTPSSSFLEICLPGFITGAAVLVL